MSLLTLRAYLAAQLPEPVLDEDRLTAFFEQEEVKVYLTQIEQLTGQIVARWPQKPATYHFIEPAADAATVSVMPTLPETLPPTEAAPAGPGYPPAPVPTEPVSASAELTRPVSDTPTPAFSFLASEEEVEVAMQSSQAVDDPAQVSPIYDIAPTPESVQSGADAVTPPPLPPSPANDTALTTTAPTVDETTAALPPTIDVISPLPAPPTTDAITPQPTPDAVRFAPTNRPDQPASQPVRSLSIPNATVGKPYAYQFDFSALGLPEPAEHTLFIDGATGLTYDHDARMVSGMPLESGEFTFELTYRTGEADRPAQSRRIQLLVNPDPRSLWKDLPSDTTDPYYKPDSAQELLPVGDVRLLAASVRGRSHAHEGKFRDDDFRLAHLPETGWYLLTVADGAGSARYSRRGAQLACQTVTDYLQRSIDPQSWASLDAAISQYQSGPQESAAGVVQRQFYDVLGKAVFDAYKAIETEARTKAAEAKDYATTLITVLAKPVAGQWFIGAFWVGDGGVGIYSADREPVVLGTPDGGEYAGQTRFLTMPETIANNFFGRFQFALVDDFTAVILMTDGVTDPKFQTDGNLGRRAKWDELWADLNGGVSFADDEQAPTQLQDWLTFWSPGNHDDRTIALLYTHGGNAKN